MSETWGNKRAYKEDVRIIYEAIKRYTENLDLQFWDQIWGFQPSPTRPSYRFSRRIQICSCRFPNPCGGVAIFLTCIVPPRPPPHPLGGHLGPSWGALGCSWPLLGRLGVLWAALGPLLRLAALGPLFAVLGPLLARSWPPLGCSEPLLGAAWPRLAALGAPLAAL